MNGIPAKSPNKNEIIDFDDHLYLYPYDNFIITFISFKLLGTENFRVEESYD